MVSVLQGNRCLLSKASRLAVEASHLPCQLITGALLLGVNWPGHEGDHLLHLVLRLRVSAVLLLSPVPSWHTQEQL
jgi:hypothetical protein